MTYLHEVENLEKLSPEQREIFNTLLKQSPHLEKKRRELNTPSIKEIEDKEVPRRQVYSDEDQLDYSNLEPEPYVPSKPKNVLKAKIDTTDHFLKNSVEPLPDRELEEIQKAKEYRRHGGFVEEAKETEKHLKQERPFNIEGKEHPILAKMKLSLGIGDKYFPKETTIGGIKYGLIRVTRDEIVKSATYAALKSPSNEGLMANIETAIIAWSIQTIDGVPKEIVFSIPDKEFDVKLDREVDVLSLRKKELASEKLYYLLNNSPNELVKTLSIFYEQEFPTSNLLSEGKSFAYCPEANCSFKRIIDVGEEAFCTYHGSKLHEEESLPNPSKTTR